MKIKIIELIVIEIEGVRLKKLSKPIIYKVNYSREDAQNLAKNYYEMNLMCY